MAPKTILPAIGTAPTPTAKRRRISVSVDSTCAINTEPPQCVAGRSSLVAVKPEPAEAKHEPSRCGAATWEPSPGTTAAPLHKAVKTEHPASSCHGTLSTQLDANTGLELASEPSPYPDWPRPSAPECRAVCSALVALHGQPAPKNGEGRAITAIYALRLEKNQLAASLTGSFQQLW